MKKNIVVTFKPYNVTGTFVRDHTGTFGPFESVDLLAVALTLAARSDVASIEVTAAAS